MWFCYGQGSQTKHLCQAFSFFELNQTLNGTLHLKVSETFSSGMGYMFRCLYLLAPYIGGVSRATDPPTHTPFYVSG